MTDPKMGPGGTAPPLPTSSDIDAAYARIQSQIRKTPLLASDALSDVVGSPVLFKVESLQVTGSFKIRGALNRLMRLTDAQRTRGVVAFSSGNHAQGVAMAARLVGTRATIVMPSDAPRIKIANTRELGATVVTYDRIREDREAIARALAARDGLAIVPAYDDFDIICGQGTVGLEMALQARELGITLGDVYAPVSGGGLIAGIATALRGHAPAALIHAVEPENYDDHRRSLADGHRAENPSAAAALCDGLLAQTPGKLTWAINRSALKSAIAVSDHAVARAVTFAFERLKLVVEPSGAAALAALLDGAHRDRNRVPCVVLTGGNVDPQTFAACLETDRKTC